VPPLPFFGAADATPHCPPGDPARPLRQRNFGGISIFFFQKHTRRSLRSVLQKGFFEDRFGSLDGVFVFPPPGEPPSPAAPPDIALLPPGG